MMRGEIYLVDLEPTTGSEMKKVRPCVIVSNNAINNNASVVIVCPVTDSYGKTSPIHIQIPNAEGGLTKPSIVHCGQVRTIDKHRVRAKIGVLSAHTMSTITRGLALSLDIPQKMLN